MTIKKARKMIRKLTGKLVKENNENTMDKIEKKIYILRDFISNEISLNLDTKGN